MHRLGSIVSMARYPELRRIFHPTNLEDASRNAFNHALRLAVDCPATLTLMHVGDKDEAHMGSMPHVRDTLRRWGVIGEGKDDSELRAKGIGVRKLLEEGDPLQACLKFLDEHRADLVVLHTHQREGRAAWLNGRVAEPVARDGGRPALILPSGTNGFVDARTGKVNLNRILIPIAPHPSPGAAIELAAWFAEALAAAPIEFTMLHIGSDHVMAAEPPERSDWKWRREEREGDVVDGILDAARDGEADLIVMTTQGHDGFLDALRGSTTERVLRKARCPLLTAVV